MSRASHCLEAVMSKTDKDRPYWVRSNDPLEHRELWHSYNCRAACFECNVDEPNKRGDYLMYGIKKCGYFVHIKPYRSVPGWFINHVWSGPERRRERDELTKARHLYNNGEMDDGFDFDSHNHRHGAIWAWW